MEPARRQRASVTVDIIRWAPPALVRRWCTTLAPSFVATLDARVAARTAALLGKSICS